MTWACRDSIEREREEGEKPKIKTRMKNASIQEGCWRGPSSQSRGSARRQRRR